MSRKTKMKNNMISCARAWLSQNRYGSLQVRSHWRIPHSRLSVSLFHLWSSFPATPSHSHGRATKIRALLLRSGVWANDWFSMLFGLQSIWTVALTSCSGVQTGLSVSAVRTQPGITVPWLVGPNQSDPAILASAGYLRLQLRCMLCCTAGFTTSTWKNKPNLSLELHSPNDFLKQPNFGKISIILIRLPVIGVLCRLG